MAGKSTDVAGPPKMFLKVGSKEAHLYMFRRRIYSTRAKRSGSAFLCDAVGPAPLVYVYSYVKEALVTCQKKKKKRSRV